MQSAPQGESGFTGPVPFRTTFFTSPFFLSLTVGVPFCIFKILFGILFIRASGMNHQILFVYSGWILIIWACTDMLLNLTRAGFDLIGKPDLIEFCTLAQTGRYLGIPEIFLALDTLITFIIICSALWSGWIVYLNQVETMLWYSATSLNLISLSSVSLITEIRRKKRR
jgi:hypothetical protein